jgi:hypothetical protein
MNVTALVDDLEEFGGIIEYLRYSEITASIANEANTFG